MPPATRAVRDDRTRTSEHLTEVPAFVWLFLAGLAFSMFSGNAALLGLPLGLDRPLLFAAVLLLVLDTRTERLRWRPVYAVMAATCLWTLWSWGRSGTFSDSANAFALADRIVLPMVMFPLGALVFATSTRRDLLLKMMVLVGTYLGFTSVFEFSNLDALVWPRFITDPSLGIQEGRARGPFLSSEPLGMVAALSLFLAGVLVSRSRSVWRTLALLCIVASGAAILLSLTRTVWLAAALGGLAVGIAAPALRRWVPLVVAGLIATIGLLLVSVPALNQAVSERLTTERSVYDRVNVNNAALRIVDAQPLFGVGWGRFDEVAVDWVRQADTYPLTNSAIEVHNVFLSRAAETGLIGAALWLLVMLTGPFTALVRPPDSPELRAWRLAALGALFVWLLPSLTSPNPYPMPNLLIWLVAGVASREFLVVPAAQAAGIPSGASS